MLPLLRVDADNRRRALLSRSDPPGEPNELEEALRILDELGNPDPLLRAEILVDLGDWHAAFNRTWVVDDAYRAAWNALAEVDNGDDLRQEWFSDLTVAYSAPFVSRHLTEEIDAPVGRVAATFTIDVNGRPDDFEVIESRPDGLLDQAARRQVLNSRYRPRMVDGRLIPSTGTVSWNFQYED
jgi:TonB family protein